MTISVSGRYTFSSSSSMDTYGCFYSDRFDPSRPNTNLIAYDDDSNGGSQFLINVNLLNGRSYVLVVTTYQASTTGSFSIRVVRPTSTIPSSKQITSDKIVTSTQLLAGKLVLS